MDAAQLTKLSKFLSKHLRHQPERLGLTLESGGWVSVDELLAACVARRTMLTRPMLDEIVERNDKQRFAFDETKTRIRAQQGHSIEVNLELEEAEPPAVLYHGTGSISEYAIRTYGLDKMRRHHVHLSADVETATKVGARHGKPVVFIVDTAAMKAEGWTFYRSGNGVWLVDSVPPQFLERMEA